MLKGLMDHWVPTKVNLSKFWMSDIEIVKASIDNMLKDIKFNNFTFYTKWYTNGIKSDLNYLYNNPDSSNVKTDNEWGNQIIDFLHSKGITAGAMLQLLTYEKKYWNGSSIGEWDVRVVANTELTNYIADFTDEKYLERMKEIIKEQLMIFPGLDFIFLEFEGPSPEMLEKVYVRWAKENNKPDINSVNYENETKQYCKKLGIDMNFQWSIEGREMLEFYYGRNLKAAYEILKELNYKGQVGVVHQLYGYEAFIYPKVLPDNGWWLLPWWYWVFESSTTAPGLLSIRREVSKELLKSWKEKGYTVCYIGDVALGKNGLDFVKEFYDCSEKLQLDGYLGMGYPDLDIGLRWVDVEDYDVLSARELYKTLYV